MGKEQSIEDVKTLNGFYEVKRMGDLRFNGSPFRESFRRPASKCQNRRTLKHDAMVKRFRRTNCFFGHRAISAEACWQPQATTFGEGSKQGEPDNQPSMEQRKLDSQSTACRNYRAKQHDPGARARICALDSNAR